MYRRFHRKPASNPSGKWERIPRTGVGHVAREEIGDWQIEISHRQVGSTVKRDQYSAVIRRESPAYEESLPAFATKQAALSAARKRVDLLSHIRQPVARGPHRARAANRK